MENNKYAVDPAWHQLKAFLMLDKTDEKNYVDKKYMCGDYTLEVHNNAEAAGIRAAYVILELEGFSVGHALNAFCTTDRGLVYIDCTSSKDSGEADSWDKVAYVKIGREYGLIDLAEASYFTYDCYEQYLLRKLAFDNSLEDYNSEVERFNRWVADQVFIAGTEEHDKVLEWKGELEVWKKTLDKEEVGLGSFWKSIGTVSGIDIYW